MLSYMPVEANAEKLRSYSTLFKACFPAATHLNAEYLQWLYASNPDGPVVGYDAYDGDRLAAHYVCVPVSLSLFGQAVRGLLSLNTATHPDYQGKGLFTTLAAKTYDYAAERGYTAVYGVANANSTPGFIRKLGFDLVAPLQARIGIGASFTAEWDKAESTAQFRRIWNDETIAWRCRNPANPSVIVRAGHGELQVRAKTDKPLISAWARVHGNFTVSAAAKPIATPGTLFLGLFPEGSYRYGLAFNIPQRLRPSPLNFIYRPLGGDKTKLESGNIICSYIDFDAY